jgi:hypothetical protein
VIPNAVLLALLPPETRHTFYATIALAALIDEGAAHLTVYKVVHHNGVSPSVCAQLNFEDGTARELLGVGPTTMAALRGLLDHPDLHADG